jgi:hypothetical protein
MKRAHHQSAAAVPLLPTVPRNPPLVIRAELTALEDALLPRLQ